MRANEGYLTWLCARQGDTESMTQSTAGNSDNSIEARLPRRDIVILPMLSLLTMAVCLMVGEAVSRHYFVYNTQDSCLIDKADVTARHMPNCTTRLKAAEGPWVTNQYNECGYRTKESCGPKPKGSIRIALLGSSASEGLFVAYDQTFAARAASDLTRISGRPVEIQNLGRAGCDPVCVYHQTGEALALKPDILILAIDPYDIRHLELEQMTYRDMPIQRRPQVDPTADIYDPLMSMKAFITRSTSIVAAEHFLFQNTAIYDRVYLHYQDNADYLRAPFSPLWEKRLAAFQVLLTEMARKSSAAHVPFVLIEIPSLPQAALARENSLPVGVDINAFNQRLKQISSQLGVQFIDGSAAFKHAPELNKLFYVTDGHLNGEGHAYVSQWLVEQLIKEQHVALLGGNELQRKTDAGHER
jgi:hypothetical protein